MAPRAEILLVEDDPHDVDLTLRALGAQELAGVVHVVRDGEEALSYMSDRDEREQPRFVLLDLKLPKIDGLEVLRGIKQNPRTSSIPVIVLTSSREARDLRAAYELGANSYLCKPVDYHGFSEVVRQIGQYWMQLNEPRPPEGH